MTVYGLNIIKIRPFIQSSHQEDIQNTRPCQVNFHLLSFGKYCYWKSQTLPLTYFNWLTEILVLIICII
jgi:hypothetical protein